MSRKVESYIVSNKEMTADNIEELAYKIFVEEADETRAVSECILDSEGVDGAIRLLEEYTDLNIERIDK